MTISTVLFDLDNTIYPPSSGVMQEIDGRINSYLQETLGVSSAQALELRKHYYHTYGTTLHGLQRHHGVDADTYLEYVHNLALEHLLSSDAQLDQLLSELSTTKVIFTNSPMEYARRVVQILGIEHHFSHIFDIRFANFLPKPNPLVYRRVLETLSVAGNTAILVEDSVQNLPPARQLGMKTILVGDQPADAATVADYHVPDAQAAVRVAIELAHA